MSIDPRHESRRLSMAVLFGWSFISKDIEPSKALGIECLEITDYNETLYTQIISNVTENVSSIDALIENCAPEWPIDKIAKIDLSCLRIAICEICYIKATPHKVAIDESVELAKEFGGDNSSKFVNGVLGTIVDTVFGSSEKEANGQ